jgi:hypothetical protein
MRNSEPVIASRLPGTNRPLAPAEVVDPLLRCCLRCSKAQIAEECVKVRGQEFRLFRRGKVAPLGHCCPA